MKSAIKGLINPKSPNLLSICLFKRLFPNETLVVDDVPHQEPEQEPEPTNLASELKEFLKRDQEVKNIVIYHQNTKYS